jgi:predicted dehydrogenase
MYKLALIGCGRISYKHVEAAIHNNEDVALIACCDTMIDKAKERATEYIKALPDTRVNVYENYLKMLEIEKPDICAIATDSGLHCAITVECLKAGAHVLCEKPMALSTDDTYSMIQTAERYKKKLGVCFQNRFNPPVMSLNNAIDKGRLGRILHGAIQIRWNRDDAYYKEADWRGTWLHDGGTLMNQCSHGIDLLQWIMGDVVRVQATTRRFLRPIEAEDFGAAIVEFSNGSVGIIEGSVCVYPKNLNETLSIFGEKGTVVIGGMAVNKIETWRFNDSDKYGEDEKSIIQNNNSEIKNVYGDGHTALYADFITAVKNNKEPLINGKEGSKAVELILAIYKSHKERKGVELPVKFSTRDMVGTF